jgi:hypothetical protein
MAQRDSGRQIRIKGDVDGIGNVMGDYSTSHVTVMHSLVTLVQTGADVTRMELNPNHTADVPALLFRHPDEHLRGRHPQRQWQGSRNPLLAG